MRKSLCLWALVLLCGTSVWGLEGRGPSSTAQAQRSIQRSIRMIDALESSLPAVHQSFESLVAPPSKAIPRADKCEATQIGAISDITGIDFLSDGTPFVLVTLFEKVPFSQEVLTACVGAANANICEALRLGQRVQFTSWVIQPDDPQYDGFYILLAKQLRTR